MGPVDIARLSRSTRIHSSQPFAPPQKNRIAWAILAPARWGSKRTACTRGVGCDVVTTEGAARVAYPKHGTSITHSRVYLTFQDVNIHPMTCSADWKTLSDLGPSCGIPYKTHPIFNDWFMIIWYYLPKELHLTRCPKVPSKVYLPSHSCPKADRMTRSIRAWSTTKNALNLTGRPSKKELILKCREHILTWRSLVPPE